MISQAGEALGYLQVTQLGNGRAHVSLGSLAHSPLHYGTGRLWRMFPFHDVVKNHGSARSLLSVLRQVLKVPFTAIALSCTKQEAMGTNVKRRQWWEVGVIRAPVSLLHCREEDVASSHGTDCYAHYLNRIMGPSGYLFQWQPANHFGLITPFGPSVHRSRPPLPSPVEEKTEGESLWPSGVCTGRLSGVEPWDKGYFRLFLLLAWIAHDWFQKEKFISLQTYFYHLLEFLDALLTICIEEPGLLQRGWKGKWITL